MTDYRTAANEAESGSARSEQRSIAGDWTPIADRRAGSPRHGADLAGHRRRPANGRLCLERERGLLSIDEGMTKAVAFLRTILVHKCTDGHVVGEWLKSNLRR